MGQTNSAEKLESIALNRKLSIVLKELHKSHGKS